MTEDPRRAIVDVIARLGRETQLHLDERYRHFRITDGVILLTSLLLVILAVFNVYYVLVLYQNLNGIVSNMESMHDHLIEMDADMELISGHMTAFDRHMDNMEPINRRMGSVASTLPRVRGDMHAITGEMSTIDESMGMVARGMGVIDQRVHLMNGGVSAMRQNVRQIARPMGSMMPFMP